MNDKKSQVMLNVGLPKTATTSFQQGMFEVGDGKYWNYLGVLQPRDREQNPDFLAFIDKVNGGGGDLQCLGREADIPLLISEEMLLIDSSGARWQEKLKSVSLIAREIDVTIIVCLRDPVEAMFSLYVELYPRIKHTYPSFEDFVENSNQAKLFDYKYLVELLDGLFGREKVKLLAFEGIKNGELLEGYCNLLGSDASQFTIPHVNTKQKSSERVYSNWSNIGAWLQHKMTPYSKRSVMGLLRSVFYKCGLLRCSLPVPWGGKYIKFPSAHLYREKFIESNNWLFERSGIDYNASS